MSRILIIILAIVLFFISFGCFVWYVFKPESVRNYCRKHPEFDLRGNIRNATNIEIRAMGIFLFLFCCLLETGLIVFITDMSNWK